MRTFTPVRPPTPPPPKCSHNVYLVSVVSGIYDVAQSNIYIHIYVFMEKEMILTASLLSCVFWRVLNPIRFAFFNFVPKKKKQIEYIGIRCMYV